MSTLPPPNSREVQEFQFKLLARLRLFDEQQAPPLKHPLSLVVAASKYGLICVGTSTGFDVVETAKIVEHCAGARKPTEVTNFPRRRVVLGAQPSHLDLSCDSQHLAVGYSTPGGIVVRIYDVTSFTAQMERVVSEVRLPAPIQALSWNPGIPNLLAACLQNGSAFVYEFKNNSFDISSIPPEAQATCLCWSPKGKQIVIGSRNGTLNQFKPDLKIVKAIPPPQNGVSVVSVHWLSNIQYAAVYTANGTGLSMVLVNTPRNQPTTYINYDDITYSNGNNRVPEFYFIHQQTWNVLLVGSSNSMEVGVLGLQGSDWEQWTQEDAARAELPLSATKQETHPVGMALDTSVQYNLPWGENQQLPSMPLLLLLSHEGLLSAYWSLNLMHGAATICTPPTPLPDTSGLYLFTSPEPPPAMKPPPLPQAEVNPQPQVAAVVPQLAQPATATVTPQPVWGQGSPIAVPKPTIGTTQGSWMMPSSTPTTFLSSSTMQPPPPAPAPSTPPAVTPTLTTPAFSAASAAAPTLSFNIAAPTPFSFTSQAPDLVSKPGGFVAPSQPIAGNPPPSQQARAPVLSVAEKVDIPEVPVLPPSSVTPEPEIGEESQELKAMNDALIEDAIREEISHFSQEMSQLKQRCQNMSTSIPVINDAALDKLSEDIHDWTEFVREVADTTKVQAYEVNSLRNFLLDVFTYVENMKTRLHLQNNPDYLSLQSPDMKDPVLARKIQDMKCNLQFIESQLVNVDSKLCMKWNMFQKSNKENREAMHIPSLEAIYQAMVMHNNVLMRQKSVVESLEKKMKTRHRGKLMSMLNISRMVDSQTENQDSEFSKILQDLLSLSVDNSKINTTNLEESLSNLLVSNSPSENLYNIQGDANLDRMALLQQIFADNTVNNLDYSVKWSSPRQNTVLPIVSASSRSGSISSGQPVTKTSTTEAVQNSATKEVQKNLLNEAIKPTGLQKLKSPFSFPSSTVSSTNVKIGLEKNHSTEISNVDFASDPKTSLLSSKKVISSSTTSSVRSTVVVTQTSSPSFFNFSSATPSSISTAPQFVIPSTSSAPKEFSFAPLPSSQAAFSSSSFGHSVQFPLASNTPFVTTSSKGFGFNLNTTSSTATSVINTSNIPTVSKSSPASNSSIFKTTTAEKSSSNVVFEEKSPVNSSPLASLSSLVSGIEPLKPCNDQIDSPIKNLQQIDGPLNEIKNTTSQPFVFKMSSSSENKISSEKDQSGFSQNVQTIFSSASNSVLSDSRATVANSTKGPADELQSKFSGAFKKLNFESTPEKSIFGGNASLNAPETVNQEQKPNTVFSVSSPSPSSLFGTSNESNAQVSVFSTTTPASSLIPKDNLSKPGGLSETVSPIIEVSLKSSKNELDSNLSFEKLSTKKDIVITKVDSVEKKSSIVEEGKLKEPDNSSSIFNTFNTSITTPTKPSQNIFGGFSLEKQLPSYEIEKPDPQNIATVDQKEEPKPDDLSKPKEATKTQSIFGGSTVNKSGPETSFSFSTSSLQSSLAQPEINKSDQTLSFSFGSSLPTTTAPSSSSSNILNTQVTSSLSFAQIGTQPSSSAFSFTIPTTNESTTTTSTFGFGNLSTGSSSDDKSKAGFSFGQLKTAVPEGNIFGGYSKKPETTSSIFGSQSTTAETNSIFGGQTTTAETKSIFGGQTTTAETKNVFGQTPVTCTATTETKSIFGQSQSSPSEPKNIFGQTSATENKNIFGQSSTNSAENKSVFGQPSTTSADTKSIFGQPSTTSADTKSIFGQPSTTSADTKNIFGQPSTTSADTKSIFGQSSAPTTESKSVFGQSSALGTKNVFGQTASAMSENTNIFGQAVATTTNSQPGFSFSLNATTSAQSPFFGSPATTATSFFGQPICSPASTASSPFGQTNTTSVFGNASQTPFGGGSSSFGQSGGSFFGQPSGGFASNTVSAFGGSVSSPFGGSSSQPSPAFGQSPGASGGSMFGGGSFSAGGQTVAQTGFGTSGFQNKPAFGASSPPAFGAAPAFGASPTFGGSASFGSPPKLFGSPASPSSTFGSSNQQQSSTFENLANQNTMTFGNLAQNQSPGFGSVFSTQASPPAPTFPPATSGSVFGGSSFSSWR